MQKNRWGSAKRVIILVTLYHHIPRSLHPKPAYTLVLFMYIQGRWLCDDGSFANFRRTMLIKNYGNHKITQLKVQDLS